MDKKIKKKWIAALLSGKYKQGFAALKTKTKMVRKWKPSDGYAYCCLGVLCDVTGLQSKGLRISATSTCSHDAGLINRSLKKTGLTASNQVDLVQMNDGMQKSFKQIAKWIDKNL